MSNPRPPGDSSANPTFTPVGIPLGASGVDLRVNPRNRSVSALSLLENASFRDERVFGRRPGHESKVVVDGSGYQLDHGPERGEWQWAYGHGVVRGIEHYPRPRQLKGVMTLGDQSVVWTGDRLLGNPNSVAIPRWFGDHPHWLRSGSASGASTTLDPDTAATVSMGLPAYLPHARHAYQAGLDYDHHDACLGRKYRLLVTGSAQTSDGGTEVGGTGVFATVLSRETGQVVRRLNLDAAARPLGIRCIYSSGRLVVLYADGGDLLITSCSEEYPGAWTEPTDIGNVTGNCFDLHYISEEHWVAAWRDGPDISLAYFTGESTEAGPFPAGTTLPIDEAATGAVAISVAPNGDLGLVYTAASSTQMMVLSAAGQGATSLAVDAEPAVRLAIAPRWLDSGAEATSTFVAYVNVVMGSAPALDTFTRVIACIGQGTLAPPVFVGSGSDQRVAFGCHLASSAFRVGDETAVWLVTNPLGLGFQDTYHLVTGAGNLRVCGATARGLSRVTVPIITAGDDAGQVHSVHPDPLSVPYGTDAPTVPQWSCALPLLAAPDSRNATTALIDLDFLPPLRWQRYGGAVYTAGALVQTFDGRNMVEAGWTQYPEVIATVASNAAGTLTAGTYVYRVYLCWRNAAGEVFRSPAATSAPLVLAAPEDTITLEITTVSMTNKPVDEMYYEIYRNEGSLPGTTFYLVERVPGVNEHDVETWFYTDVAPDTEITSNEIDPHNPAVGQAVELEEAAPPGCELLVAHTDRLWFAGGEIPGGQLAFSKQKELTEGMGWSDLVGSVTVDVTGGKIISMAPMNDALTIFGTSTIGVQQGLGPDNLGNGDFPPAGFLASADGATVHEGTVVGDLGIHFWSRGGPRLLTTGYQIVHIGAPVEPLAAGLTPSGCLAVPGKREIRWYTAAGKALLWDYTPGSEGGDMGRWAVWTGLSAAGVAVVASGPVIACSDGRFLTERGTLSSDGGQAFKMAWATWELYPGSLVTGANVVSRTGINGRVFAAHTLRTWIYYNGAPGWSEYYEWTPASDLDLRRVRDVLTAVEDDTELATSPDGAYRAERQVRRTPFATIRIRQDDGGSSVNTMEPHEVMLEVGALAGTSRMPRRTYTRSFPREES